MAKPAPQKKTPAPLAASNYAAPPVAPPPAWWLPATLVVYAILAFFYVTATPLQAITLPDNLPEARAQTPLVVGIGPDEKEHFLYIASLAERGKLPAQSPAFRTRAEDFVSYEVQHPPLFFALFALLYKVFLPLVGPLGIWFVLRGACALCGAGIVVLVHKTAQIAFPNRPLVVWGAAPVCAFLPTFGHTMANLSNEPLALLLGAFLWWQAVRLLGSAPLSAPAEKPNLRPAMLMGATFGVGLLIKLTVIVWLPALCLALWFGARHTRQNVLVVLAAFAVPAALLAAPWFGYLYANFGTFAFRSHMRPLLNNITLWEYLQNPTQRLFPKNIKPPGLYMPPAYFLVWGSPTAVVPFWLVYPHLPGGPPFVWLWQITLAGLDFVPLLALLRHTVRARADKQAAPDFAARVLLWAGGTAMLMATLTLLYQIFQVDWSMTNYGGRYLVSSWPAACLVTLFALSTLPEPGPKNALSQRSFAGGVTVGFLLLDIFAVRAVRQFYQDNPTQPAIQRSEEVTFSGRGLFLFS